MSSKSSQKPGVKRRPMPPADQTAEERHRLMVLKEGLENGSVTLGDLVDISEDQIRMFLDHGIKQFRAQRFEEAREVLEMVLALSPYNAEGWRAFGALMQEIGELEEAVYAYNLALIHNPEDPVCMMYKGQALLRLDRREEGLEFLEKGIELGAKRPDLEPWVQRSRAILSSTMREGAAQSSAH